jgi:hypothetical protein
MNVQCSAAALHSVLSSGVCLLACTFLAVATSSTPAENSLERR